MFDPLYNPFLEVAPRCFFQATIQNHYTKCDSNVSGNRRGNVALYIGGKYRSSIQPQFLFLPTESYEYCIPFSKMQDDDGKLETISFVPDNDGVSLCLTDHE